MTSHPNNVHLLFFVCVTTEGEVVIWNFSLTKENYTFVSPKENSLKLMSPTITVLSAVSIETQVVTSKDITNSLRYSDRRVPTHI